MLEKILNFLDSIGIEYSFTKLAEEMFLPGLALKEGVLQIDREKLRYVGDVLHEAGHLACMPPDIRRTMDGVLEINDLTNGGEMMAMAWSFAACKHLDISTNVVFHEDGYKGDAQNLITNFENGTGVGIPLLQWLNMCYDEKIALAYNQKPFPFMLKWTCTENKYQ